MALAGTVTRTMGDTIVEAQQTAQGNVACFIAYGTDGTAIGSYRSAGEAQAAVNQRFGQILRWTRQDLRGGVEFYIGEY